jgi:hypothetical protein
VPPNAVLVDMGINDPATLTSAGISASVGTGTVTVTPGPASTEIAITDITFSPPDGAHQARHHHPGCASRPADSPCLGGGRLPHLPRGPGPGSYVRSYQASCRAAHHRTRYGTSSRTRLRVAGLARGVSYSCQVRAKAVVGYGRWSGARKLAG